MRTDPLTAPPHADLAAVYGVSTKALNQAVKRNTDRFPADFLFQLNEEEKLEVVTNCDRFPATPGSSIPPQSLHRTRRPRD